MTDWLIVGLGNPGKEHAEQRHNAGFWVVSRLAKRHAISFHNSSLASSGRGTIEGADVVLMKPRTYYNGTGKAVAPLMRKDGIPVERLIVIHDDLDLPEGRIRLRPRGSDAGNNGMKSIIAAIGSSDFGRLRLGIGRPKDLHGVPTWDSEVVVRWVLAMPPKAARELLDDAVERACDAIERVITHGWERAMDTYNRVETGDRQEA